MKPDPEPKEETVTEEVAADEPTMIVITPTGEEFTLRIAMYLDKDGNETDDVMGAAQILVKHETMGWYEFDLAGGSAEFVTLH